MTVPSESPHRELPQRESSHRDPGTFAGRRGLIAWCFYDWANSSYPTVIVTFVFAAYFTTALSIDTATGTANWGNALALSGLAVAVLAPILGALADQGGRRKPWIAGFTALAVVSAFGPGFRDPGACTRCDR